ncbi:LppA family lipoprotein [Amycolatopsis sp. NPDC051102]|uniref:LppA family lipoprotein n=1 Tax=Amycolatopsis sp. NPDC051102 TaxID=3155163 RepID=UPI003447353D
MSRPASLRWRPLGLAAVAVAAPAAATTLVLSAAPVAPVVSSPAPGPSPRAREYAILQTRPDIDAVVATDERLLADVRDVLTTMQHWGPWQRRTTSMPIHSSGCSEFPATDVYDATKATLPAWYTPASHLDWHDWPSVRGKIVEVGYRFGFGVGPVGSDVPGNYLLTLVDNTGGSVQVGADVNATVSATTGCHLTRTARERGTPAPEDTPTSRSPR